VPRQFSRTAITAAGPGPVAEITDDDLSYQLVN
jgi:hypothetical protein